MLTISRQLAQIQMDILCGGVRIICGILPEIGSGLKFALELTDALGATVILPSVLMNQLVQLAVVFHMNLTEWVLRVLLLLGAAGDQAVEA